MDDVLCDDFGFKSTSVGISVNARCRLNKDIAHLTYSRLRHTPVTKPWPIPDILDPVRDRSAEFVAHVVNNPPAGCNADEIDRWKDLQRKLTKSV
jgi:hypothetical protein